MQTNKQIALYKGQFHIPGMPGIPGVGFIYQVYTRNMITIKNAQGLSSAVRYVTKM